MPASLSDWVDRLGNRPLPAMAPTVRRVTQLIDSPSTTNSDYQCILTRDPGFTLALFRHLAKLPQPPRERISNLAHAAALSGTAPLRNLARTLPVLEKAHPERAGQDLYGCYARAAHAAYYVGRWAQDRPHSNREEMVIAALLHECGEMALWAHASGQMQKIDDHVQRGMSRENAALAVLGFTLNQLSQALAEFWMLPLLTARALQPLGAFQTPSLGVMLASELSTSSFHDWGSESTLELLELVAEYCRLSHDRATAYVHRLSAEAARNLYGLPLSTVADRLLHLHPEVPATPHPIPVPDPTVNQDLKPPPLPAMEESPQAASLGKQRETPHTPTGQGILESTPLIRLMNQQIDAPQESQQATDRLAQSLPQQKKDTDTVPRARQREGTDGTAQNRPASILQEHLIAVTGKLRENLGLERSMFAMLTPDKKSLQARFVTGAGQDEPLGRFELDLEQRHLFSLLITKPHGFWLNRENRKMFLPAIPGQLQSTLNLDGFFASSLFVNHNPLGILYADRSDPSLLNSESFNQFKQLAQELGTRLAGLPRAV